MNGEFPWPNIRRLAEIGILGMAVPKAYGGARLPVFDTALVLEEIAKGCYVTAMAVLGEVGRRPASSRPTAPKPISSACCRASLAASICLSICMTEPHAGTDVAAYRTNAVIRGDKLVLNGEKSLVSRAEEASAFVVFARIDGRRAATVSAACWSIRATPGFHASPFPHHGRRISCTTIRFDELRIAGRESLLGPGSLKKAADRPSTRSAASTRRSRSGSPKAPSTKRAYARDRRRSAARSASSRACAGNSPTCGARSRLPAGCSIAPAPAPIRFRIPSGGDCQGLLQRNVASGHQRGDPGISAATALPMNIPSRGCIAPHATAAWAAARRRHCATCRQAADGRRRCPRSIRAGRFLTDVTCEERAMPCRKMRHRLNPETDRIALYVRLTSILRTASRPASGDRPSHSQHRDALRGIRRRAQYGASGAGAPQVGRVDRRRPRTRHFRARGCGGARDRQRL